MKIYSEVNTNVSIPTKQTSYLVGSGLLENLHKIIKEQGINYSSFLILTDKKAFDLFGNAILSALRKLDKPIMVSQLVSSEKMKDINQISDIIKPYFQSGINRNSCLVSMGGGIISDLGGFIASILLRGIDSIYIPTTLLAQVDAAIGGKTGVNFHDKDITYKNMLGSFYQPKLVISDIDTLKTLPNSEFTSGLGEIVKYWVGWGKPTPAQMEAIKTPRGWQAERSEAMTPPMVEELMKVISTCQKIKLDIVKQDPFETNGERQKLNLGHTIGHAIEGAANGKLSHGKAVSIGLAAAAKISLIMNLLNENLYKIIINNILGLGLPTTISSVDINYVLKALKLDKKGGDFVLIKDIGDLITGVKVENKIINQVLEEIIC